MKSQRMPHFIPKTSIGKNLPRRTCPTYDGHVDNAAESGSEVTPSESPAEKETSPTSRETSQHWGYHVWSMMIMLRRTSFRPCERLIQRESRSSQCLTKTLLCLVSWPARPTVENPLPKLTKKTLFLGTVPIKKLEKEATLMLLTANSYSQI
jgi:hypothetical protein